MIAFTTVWKFVGHALAEAVAAAHSVDVLNTRTIKAFKHSDRCPRWHALARRLADFGKLGGARRPPRAPQGQF